ncbi:hypothetical protein D3C73_1215030 [compost metagenome]
MGGKCNFPLFALIKRYCLDIPKLRQFRFIPTAGCKENERNGQGNGNPSSHYAFLPPPLSLCRWRFLGECSRI